MEKPFSHTKLGQNSNVWAKFQKKAVRMYLLLFVLFLYLFLTFKLFKRLKCFLIKKEKFFSDAFVYMYVCMKADYSVDM